MNSFELTTLIIASYLLVCLQVTFDGILLWMHGYIWFPCLVLTYAVIRQPAPVAWILCVITGFWIDSLSLNPLGLSILALGLATFGAGRAYRNFAGDRFLSIFAPGFIMGTSFPLAAVTFTAILNQNPLGGWRIAVSILLSGLVTGALSPVFQRVMDIILGSMRFKPVYHTEPREIREISRG
jgi:rod shape-determining protein MreD